MTLREAVDAATRISTEAGRTPRYATRINKQTPASDVVIISSDSPFDRVLVSADTFISITNS